MVVMSLKLVNQCEIEEQSLCFNYCCFVYRMHTPL
jgi:hypothetical protein